MQDWTRYLPKRAEAPAAKLRLVPNFLTKKELAALLKAAQAASFARSDVDEQGVLVQREYRSSSSAALKQDSVVRRVLARVGDVLGTFPSQCEPPQLVRYTPGQEYDVHHDAATAVPLESGDFDLHVELPRRKFSCLVYLTDHDEHEGGATWFPKLGVAVRPRAGAALFWRNFDNDGEPDPDVLHAGQPLKSGLKLAINIWVHP
jgi:prolyl 4-hydroxylase